jgi:hypothetical protein
MWGNSAPIYARTRKRAAASADEMRLTLHFGLCLAVAMAIVLAELFVFGPAGDPATKQPKAGETTINVPAFVLPPPPPSDVLIGDRIRVG